MAEIMIGAMGRTVTREGSHVKISGPSGSLGFWSGRGGLPEEKIDNVIRRHERNAGRESARVVLETIRRTIPKRTGRTARTFEINEVAHIAGSASDDSTWHVGSTDDNAIRLEDGTGIYGPRHRVIHATSHRYMKFPARAGGGFRLDDTPRTLRGQRHPNAGYVYRKSIRGMRPHRYLEEAAREARPLVIRIHKDAARAAAAELRIR